jgi:hypothetical protein
VKRPRLLDALLLAVGFTLWSVCFVLHVREVVHGRLARVSVFVSSPENLDAYPTFIGFWPGSAAATPALVVGDRLTRVGSADLRGVGSVAFLAQAYEQAQGKLEVRLAFTRAGQPGETLLRFDPVIGPWGIIPMILGLAVTGLLVQLRMPRSRQARAYLFCSFAYSIHWSLFFGGMLWQTYAWVVVYTVSSVVIFPLILHAVLVLPEEVAPTNRWMLAWPWLFALRGPTAFSWYFGWPLPHELGMRATNLLEFAFLVVLLTILTVNFRRTGPLGRRQLKWLVYGFYIGVAPVLTGAIIAILNPQLWWVQEASMSAIVFIPICLSIAILRFNLFDIDRLISSTAAYSILLMILGAGVLTAAPTLSASLSTLVGIERTVGNIALSLFLAAVIVPGQRYLRPQIERLFFANRYEVERGVQQLVRELPSNNTPQSLLAFVGERLFTVLRAENCVIYGRVDSHYAPVFVRGSIVPPPFEAHSPLVGALQARAIAVDIDRWQRTMRVSLNRSERAMLDGLRIAVALPIGRGEAPLAFLCLGHKRSGDVYTSTDLKTLRFVDEKTCEALLRFENPTILRQSAAME